MVVFDVFIICQIYKILIVLLDLLEKSQNVFCVNTPEAIELKKIPVYNTLHNVKTIACDV